MTSTKILFSGISYLLIFGLSFIPNLWIFFGEPIFIRWTSIIFFVLHVFYIYKFKSFLPRIDSTLRLKLTTVSLLVLGIIFFITFPIRNLALGDGILLIENIILETLAFQYSVVPDELLEGFAHSLLYKFLLPRSLKAIDPSQVTKEPIMLTREESENVYLNALGSCKAKPVLNPKDKADLTSPTKKNLILLT
jgi:hypothetical protein